MSFSFGSSSLGMGPRILLSEFGEGEHKAVYNPHLIKRLLKYLKPYTGKMILAFLLTLVESGLILLTPYLMRMAIDDYITVKQTKGLLFIGLAIFLSFIFTFIVSSGQRYLISWVGQKLLATLRSDLFSHLQRLHIGYHDRHSVGVTVSRVINDVAEINELLSQGIITLFGDLLVLIGIIITMLTMSPKLALLTFTVMPIMIFVTWLFSRQARVAYRNTRSKVAAVVGDLAEDINGIRAIQAFAQ